MKILLLIISNIFLVFSTCIFSTSNKNSDELKFSHYSNKIKLIDLPFNISCDSILTGTKLELSDSLIDKFSGVANARIYGKLYENKDYTAIIYLIAADIVLPVLIVTDNKGNKISSLDLLEEPCETGPDYFNFSWLNISKDLRITLKDSSGTFKRDTSKERLGLIIDSTLKSYVKINKYKISNSGQIEIIKNSP